MNEILDEFSHIIKAVESSSTVEKYGYQILKIKIRLTDGSSLRVWEKSVGGFLQRYSYYWLDEVDNQIVGWDNAPHHQGLETFPNHKHVGDKALASQDRLWDVFTFIAERLA